MISLNTHLAAPRIGLRALCLGLPLSLTSIVAAQAMPIDLASAPATALPFTLAASPRPRLQLEPRVASDALSLAPDVEVLLHLGQPALATGDAPLAAMAAPLCVAFARTVITSSGAIENDVNAFRALLGDPNNGAQIGEQPAGRREINWDGVPAAVTNVAAFPNNFFNANSPRGLIYAPASRALEVSDDRFAHLNPTYVNEFNPFSGQKLFAPRGNNVSEVVFRVPGNGVTATVRGFGAVFMDVDTADVSGFELLDEDLKTIGTFAAPVRSDARGASFVGVVFRNPRIASVRIITGNGRLAADEIDISQGGQHDLVVLDDFLYSEPTQGQ